MSNESNSKPPPIPVPDKVFEKKKYKRRGQPKLEERSAFDQLSPQRKHFVMKVLRNEPAPEAVKQIWQPSNQNSANVHAAHLLKDKRIQNALQEKIRQIYPDVEEKIAKELHVLLELPLKFGFKSADEGATVSEKLAIIDKYVKIFGFEAPKKVQSLQAKINLLPGQDKP